jgi:hypothetical protein
MVDPSELVVDPSELAADPFEMVVNPSELLMDLSKWEDAFWLWESLSLMVDPSKLVDP